MIKAVFFDLDDTLLGTGATRHERAVMVADRLSQERPGLDRDQIVTSILEPFSKPGVRGAIVGGEGIVNELGLADTDTGREIVDLWYFKGLEHLLMPVDGALDAIATIDPAITIGIITSGKEEIQRRKFDSMKLHDRISVFVSSGRAGFTKPDIRIFQLALNEAGVEAHESVFIGDAYDIDVRGALAAGLHAIWFNGEGQSVEAPEPGSHEIRSFADFAAVLEELSR